MNFELKSASVSNIKKGRDQRVYNDHSVSDIDIDNGEPTYY